MATWNQFPKMMAVYPVKETHSYDKALTAKSIIGELVVASMPTTPLSLTSRHRKSVNTLPKRSVIIWLNKLSHRTSSSAIHPILGLLITMALMRK